MLEKVLIENGFSEKEAKVYLAALQGGELPISHIASLTHLKRTTVYSLVDELVKKGVLSVTKRRGILFVAALSPKILVERFKKSAHMAEEILPTLIEMAYSSPFKPRIRFFEGPEGIKQILREFSYSKTQSMGFTDYEKMPKGLFQFIRKEVILERKKQRNRAMLIIPDNETNRHIHKEDEKYFTNHRIVHFPLGENPIELLLFEESKVAFLSFSKDELFGLIIDSSAIYRTLKNIFLFMWNGAQERI